MRRRCDCGDFGGLQLVGDTMRIDERQAVAIFWRGDVGARGLRGCGRVVADDAAEPADISFAADGETDPRAAVLLRATARRPRRRLAAPQTRDGARRTGLRRSGDRCRASPTKACCSRESPRKTKPSGCRRKASRSRPKRSRSCATWIAAGREVGEALGVRAAQASDAARGERRRVGAQSDRRVRPREARSGRTAARTRRPTSGRWPAAPISTSPACRRRTSSSTQFLGDESPDAWERLVDELLASPHYGEHWARHWLDLVRFAETNSFERDGAEAERLEVPRLCHSLVQRRQALRPVRARAAGRRRARRGDRRFDHRHRLLSARHLGRRAGRPAAGAVRRVGRHHFDDEPGDARADRRLRPLPRSQDRSDSAGRLLRPAGVLCRRDAVRRSAATRRRNSQWDMSSPEEAALRRTLRDKESEIDARTSVDGRGRHQADVGRRSATQRNARPAAAARRKARAVSQCVGVGAVSARRASAMEAAREKIDELAARRMRRWRWPVRCASRADAHHGARQSACAGRRGRATLSRSCSATRRRRFPPAPRTPARAGRRRVLAEWIASPRNMLTARVIVNRVWQHHFGRGIVRSANNFGELGTPPTHPGAARLARAVARRSRLAAQAAAPADHDVERLSHVVRRQRTKRWPSIRRTTCSGDSTCAG